ncbi:MAG: pyridoxal phosphate-dependent aminotransferase [Alphaproteobacteria bacterium]|nr:pyridoxal phosphate-dependent aminotransferase [Alphaproteobacteria bacterium]
MKLSNRGRISPFHVMEVLREANALAESGEDIIHLSVGQPWVEVPEKVRQHAAKLLTDGATLGYTDAKGIMPLRRKISQFYKDREGIDVPPERIIVTVGSSAAFYITLLSAFDVGDKVAIAIPYYPAYPNMLEAAGLVPVYIRTDASTHYQPTVEMLEALPEKPAGLVIASPSNPAGTVIDKAELERIVRYCDANGIRLISDEIYHGITYGGVKAASAAGMSPNAVVVNSFSKYFLMPGWRLGWAVVPEELQRSYESLLQNFFISPPAISQHAAVAVFDCLDELDSVVGGYARNREILLEELPKLGFRGLSPAHGAFYIYADVGNFTNDSDRFCKDILQQTGVSIVPGQDFDREEGHHFIRFTFAAREAHVRESLQRLKNWLK